METRSSHSDSSFGSICCGSMAESACGVLRGDDAADDDDDEAEGARVGRRTRGSASGKARIGDFTGDRGGFSRRFFAGTGEGERDAACLLDLGEMSSSAGQSSAAVGTASASGVVSGVRGDSGTDGGGRTK